MGESAKCPRRMASSLKRDKVERVIERRANGDVGLRAEGAMQSPKGLRFLQLYSLAVTEALRCGYYAVNMQE